MPVFFDDKTKADALPIHLLDKSPRDYTGELQYFLAFMRLASSRARPRKSNTGFPLIWLLTSASCQLTPSLQPVPMALKTASLAAKRPAKVLALS